MKTVLRSAVVTPALVGFIVSSRLRQRPGGAYRALQRIDPVHRSPLGVFVVSGHEEVSAALRNPALGSDESKADSALLNLGLLERVLGRTTPKETKDEFIELFHFLMLFRDPPDHTRLRALVAKAFTPKRVEGLRPRATELVDEILDRARRRRCMELMADFAYPLAARVICEMLGLDDDGVDLFLEQAPALAIALDPNPMRTADSVARANTATRILSEYVRALIAARRTHPTDDLLSGLVHAENEGSKLSEDELVATVLLLVIAGHETTANVLGNTIHRLVRAAAIRRALATGDDDVTRAGVEEALRLDGPVQMVERIALEQTAIGHATLERGRIAVLLLAAANRDNRVFRRPGEFRLDRDRNPHVAFGGGHHFCVGAPLARMELGLALPALCRLGDTLELDGRPAHRRSFTIRGFASLPLRW